MTATVRGLLEKKGQQTLSVDCQATVFDALGKMAEHDVGSLLITRNGTFAGLFTERDYARKVVLEGKSSKQTAVGELMDPEVVCVSPDDPLEQCMALMTAKRTRHLPVLEQGQVVGIVSIGDVVKHLLAEKDFTIQQLESYVFGNYGG